MSKQTSNSSHLNQLRSAQAARAFQNRPQAGQQGQPQNRAERRHAAKIAGRKAKDASFNTAAAQKQADVPFNAKEAVAAAPAVMAKGAASAALKVGRGFTSGSFFPWREMVPVLMFMCFVFIVVGLWWNIPGLHAGFLGEHSHAIDVGLGWAAFLGAMVMSYRTFVPMAVTFVMALVSASATPGPLFFTSLLAAFAMAIPWLMGPQVGGKSSS